MIYEDTRDDGWFDLRYHLETENKEMIPFSNFSILLCQNLFHYTVHYDVEGTWLPNCRLATSFDEFTILQALRQ